MPVRHEEDEDDLLAFKRGALDGVLNNVGGNLLGAVVLEVLANEGGNFVVDIIVVKLQYLLDYVVAVLVVDKVLKLV